MNISREQFRVETFNKLTRASNHMQNSGTDNPLCPLTKDDLLDIIMLINELELEINNLTLDRL